METQTLQSINGCIGYFMAEHGISKEQMAKMLGFTPNTLRNKMSGKTSWTWQEALLLSDVLGRSLDEIAGLAR